MSIDSQRYRNRAKDARNMAKATYDDVWRAALESMAADFDEEADRLEGEERSANQP